MRHQRLAMGVVGALLLLAGCGSADRGVTPSAVATSAATTAPTGPQLTPTPPATTAPAAATVPPTPTQPPTPSGPDVLASTLYPYRIAVAAGPTAFVPARAPWDGVQALSTDSVTLDHARAPGVSLVFLAMTDTALDVDGFASQMEDRMRAWHGCTQADGRRSFDVGELRGIGFTQRCAGEELVRAVLVGNGHALFAFTYAGLDVKTALGRLIDFLGGAEWIGG